MPVAGPRLPGRSRWTSVGARGGEDEVDGGAPSVCWRMVPAQPIDSPSGCGLSTSTRLIALPFRTAAPFCVQAPQGRQLVGEGRSLTLYGFIK